MPVSPKIGTVIQGRKGQYEILRILNQGNMAWSLEVADVSHARRRTFLKYYLSPTPCVDWYGAYVDYVNEINKRLEGSNAAQYCVLCQDLFTANPKPGKCPDEYLFQAFEFIDSGCDLRGLLDRGDLTWDKRKSIAKVHIFRSKDCSLCIFNLAFKTCKCNIDFFLSSKLCVCKSYSVYILLVRSRCCN